MIFMGQAKNIKNDITFVIPSHNGGKYLKSTVLKILGQRENNFKLVVSFNDLVIPDWASKIDDERFFIFQTQEILSMARHYEFILSQINTPWVSILGDDDSILEDGINVIRNKIKDYPDAKIHMFRRSYFYWPTEHKKPIMSKLFFPCKWFIPFRTVSAFPILCGLFSTSICKGYLFANSCKIVNVLSLLPSFTKQ